MFVSAYPPGFGGHGDSQLVREFLEIMGKEWSQTLDYADK